jgi:hypothetical protein
MLELKFKEHIIEIKNTIIKQIISVIMYNFNNHNDTFYNWFMTNSDYDFVYIYEMAFKKYFLENFTIETERILSYYSQNLVYAVSTYYEMYRDLTGVEHFISIFVTKQLEYIDNYQLFMEN